VDGLSGSNTALIETGDGSDPIPSDVLNPKRQKVMTLGWSKFRGVGGGNF